MPTESPVSAASNASPPALHSGRKARDAAAGRPAEHEAAPDGHFVQFYETEEFLVTSISQFIAAGLRAGEGALIIATENHRTRAEERLSADGFDVQRLKADGQLAVVDAAEMLSRFMTDGSLDEQRFLAETARMVNALKKGRSGLRAFGEMVAVLRQCGKDAAVHELERLWNRVARQEKLKVLCAYPMSAFTRAENGEFFEHVCDAHSHVLPTESFSWDFGADQLRAIATLQRKAAALEAEVAERKRVEAELRRRNQELTTFVETAAVGLNRVNADGVILWANAAELEMLGYAAEEYIGHPVTEFHVDPAAGGEFLRRLRTGETLRDYPARLRCKDGSTRDVLMDASVLWEDGRFVHTQCFTRDVTSRNRAERALAHAARQQSALYRFVERRRRAETFSQMYEAAIEAILSALGCQRAAILLRDGQRGMRFAASHGLSEAYRKAVEGHSPWPAEEPNPQPVCIPDVATADLDPELKRLMAKEGIGAVTFIPLMIDRKLGGKFATYYDGRHEFSRQEVELSLTIARQLALGIDRMRAEHEARERAERISQLLSLMPAAVYTCDAEGHITYFNRRAAELWGREPELMTGERFCGSLRLRRLDGSVLPHTEAPMAAAVRSGLSTRNGEVVIERPDGSSVVASFNIDPLYDEAGSITGAINVFQDISERKQMEDALRRARSEEEARRIELETLMEAVPAVVWIAHDPECRQITGNHVGCEILRLPRGRNLSRSAPPPERPTHFDLYQNGRKVADDDLPIQKAARTGRAYLGEELELRFDDGSSEWLYGNAVPLFDADQKVRGVLATFVNITERKRAEELVQAAKEELETRVRERTASLKEAMEQMEEFSYTVSHDLRAPVRAMQGYAEVVLEEFGDRLDETAREYLDRIIRGGRRMDQLIQDILTYSRLSRREVQLEPVSLDKLLRDILQQYPGMQPPGARITIVGELPAVMGHEPSLVQAISNLLSNATKFVSSGTATRVMLRAERRNGYVRLWIEDNGIGIRPEHQHRLFGLFERIHPEQRYEGTGIGLAIVRKALERMGGKVGVESDGLTGSRFWIQLPAAQA